MMKKTKNILITIAIIVAVIVVAVVGYNVLKKYAQASNSFLDPTTSETQKENASSQGSEAEKKTKATDFKVYDKDGKAVNLSDFKGKLTFVNFWATWCGYCKQEMPGFENIYKKYKDEVNFVIVNATDGERETKEAALKYVTEQGFTFPIYYDIDMSAASAYNVSSLPFSLLIDKDQNIVGYAVGMLSEEALVKALEENK